MAELLMRNLLSQGVELVQRPRTMLKKLYFGVGYQIFQISPGVKSLYHRGRKLVHLLAAEKKFGTGEIISANLSAGEASGAHLTGAL